MQLSKPCVGSLGAVPTGRDQCKLTPCPRAQFFPGLKRTAIFPLTAEGPITSNAQNFFQGMRPETIKLRPFWSFETIESTKNFLTSKHYLVGSRLEPLWSEFHGWSITINNIDPWVRDPTVPSSPSHNSFDRSIQNGGSQFVNDVVSAWCLVTRTIALIWPYTVRALYPRSLWSLEHSSHFTPRSACHCRRFGQVKLLIISIFPYLSISLKIWNGQAREPGELKLIPHHSRKKHLRISDSGQTSACCRTWLSQTQLKLWLIWSA